MTKLSVVIPVLNESDLINELVNRIKFNVEKVTKDFEIIIDDGSVDQTWNKITEKTKEIENLKGIKFSRNFGHHFAITAGLKQSSGDWVVVMDGDLQDRPEVIPDLFAETQKGYDIVFVNRKNRPEKKLYLMAQKIYYLLIRFFSGRQLNSKQANFSIISRKVADAFETMQEVARFYGSTINWLGFKKGEIVAEHGTRFGGKASYTFRKRLKLALDIFFSSDKPKRNIMVLQTIVMLIMGGILVYIKFGMRDYFQDITIAELFFLYTLLIMATQVILNSILNLYVIQIYLEVRKRPLYIIEDTINI